MACWVRGHFKNVNGTIEFDPEHPGNSSVEVSIDGEELWSDDPDRDGHLKTANFLDVETHPAITLMRGQDRRSRKECNWSYGLPDELWYYPKGDLGCELLGSMVYAPPGGRGEPRVEDPNGFPGNYPY